MNNNSQVFPYKNSHHFPYINHNDCINCGICIPACPYAGVIIWKDDLESYELRTEYCLPNPCELECIDVCPANAIHWYDKIET